MILIKMFLMFFQIILIKVAYFMLSTRLLKIIYLVPLLAIITKKPLFDTILLFAVTGIFIYWYNFLFVKLNPYIQVKRTNGKISMTYNFKFIEIKKKVGRNSLDFLAKQFAEGILTIPDNKSLKKLKKFEVVTHENMLNKILSYYPSDSVNIKLKKCKWVSMKAITMGNPIKVFNKTYFRYLSAKSNIYKITITRNDIDSVKKNLCLI